MLKKTVVLGMSLVLGLAGVVYGENLMPNPGAERVITSFDFLKTGLHVNRTTMAEYVPEGWTCYNGDGHCTWGSTDKEAHTGKRSVFLKFDKFRIKKTGEKTWTNFAICLGKGNGYVGKYAIKAEPNATYHFSFWMKGDIPAVRVEVTGWTTEEATSKDIQRIRTTLERILPGKDWARYEGSFMTEENTKRFVVRLIIRLQPGVIEPGQSIYVDDVEIVKEIPLI